jgi:tRNA 2-thiocytidine biosynthesis protein TtcA
MGTVDFERRLYRQMRATCEEHALLEPGDRVMVAISGGKDSHALLHLLHKLVARLPFEVSLVAVHLDQRQPGYDGSSLVRYLEATGFPFEILSEDTYSVVKSTLEEGATYCSLCSRLRRGILYSAAERIGANKIALGHHRDDSLETFMLNLFYSGKLQAMPASYRTDDGRFQVIRPLIECAEREIAAFAEEAAFPILPCNLCGSQDGLKREAMTKLIDSIEKDHPHVRSIMTNALRNVRPTHLLDRDLAAAWAARAPEVRPALPARRTRENATAEPVIASPGRLHLPVIGADVDLRSNQD